MTLSRPGTVAALIGGAALALDAIIIAIANSSVGLADNAVWLIGLAGLITAAGLSGRDLTRRLSGPRRLFAGFGLTLGLIAASVLAMVALDAAGAHLGANRGIHDELGTFGVGLAWFLAGLGSHRSSRQALAEPRRRPRLRFSR